ncbi:MAG: type IX secretion system membrane protein PorP/SprF, partial [Bacteroidales bacterium]|nr:type IX secretion system membrane protein PorP/SprF [Bacteroidales bacterium]
MKKIRILILALILPSAILCGQQDPVLSNYMFNTQTYNPGYSGMSGMITATALTRQQWVGFPGAPSTMIFNVNTPFSLFGLRSGAGLLVEADKFGFSNDIGLSLSYSYLFTLGTGTLGAGISAGMLNMTISPEWYIPSGPGHTPPSGDPLIPENDESFIAPDISAGVYYQGINYYAGISVTHLNQPKVKYSETATYVSRQYYLTAGYYFRLPNPAFELIPSVFIVNDGATTQYLATGMVRYNKKIWGGVSYRISDAITGFAGIELYNGLKVGYGYDFPI